METSPQNNIYESINSISIYNIEGVIFIIEKNIEFRINDNDLIKQFALHITTKTGKNEFSPEDLMEYREYIHDAIKKNSPSEIEFLERFLQGGGKIHVRYRGWGDKTPTLFGYIKRFLLFVFIMIIGAGITCGGNMAMIEKFFVPISYSSMFGFWCVEMGVILFWTVHLIFYRGTLTKKGFFIAISITIILLVGTFLLGMKH